MASTRIYTAQSLHGDALISLEPEPSRHIARALRMQAGDNLTLFNGQGGEYSAVITAVDKKSVRVALGNHHAGERESPLAIHLGIAVSRGERMDWVVQKATELGVSALTPLVTSRTGVKLAAERADKKLRHWRQIAVSACEQCGRNRLPAITPLQDLGSWLEETRAERKFVLHHRAQPGNVAGPAPASIALLIGPEGGLSASEIQSAQNADYGSLRLGPRVLRTETAPLAAIAILQGLWGDMAPGG